MLPTHLSSHERKRARRLLRELLPKARARLAQGAPPSGRWGAIGQTIQPYLRLERILGVRVYPGEHGGWHADLLLDIPVPGVPDVIGTPVGNPCRTREDAIDVAVFLLAGVLARADEPVPPPVGQVIFELYGTFLAFAEDAVREVAGRAAIQPLPIEQAPALIDTILRENGEPIAFPGYRFDPDRLPADQRQRLFLVLLFALARGLFRHPPRVAAAPGGIVPPERLQ